MEGRGARLREKKAKNINYMLQMSSDSGNTSVLQ